MKKLLTISALLGSLIIFAPSQEASAATTTSVAEPQIRIQLGQNRRWRNRNRRSFIQTRIVRRGFATFRETYRVTYLPNGAVRTRLISRERIGGRRY
ncbi:MAG: hypothetical protein M3384_03415 [Acidobacteriota bacterium]|nr:hypothetical protein [Acidobacteriota bacterium]